MKDFAGWCIHFNGIQHATCKAGVNYLALAGGEEFGMAKRIPCIKGNGVDPAVCASCHYPTPDEVAVMEADLQSHMDAMRETMEILGAAHTDEATSPVYVCQLCPQGARTVTTENRALFDHLADAHQLDAATVKTATGKMSAHLDARDWYQTDYRFTLPDGRELLIRSTRIKRRGANRAAWEDSVPRRKKRKP
jgi:hypothetical protein